MSHSLRQRRLSIFHFRAMLQYHRFVCNMVQVNSYLVWDESKLACIIDPGFSNSSEELELINFLDQEGLQLSRCIATHLHFDHVLGARFIKEHFGIPLEAPRGEIDSLPNIDQQLKAFGIPVTEGKYTCEAQALPNTITIGNTTFEVIKTPGHSPDHITLYQPENGVIFCGDVIFRGGFGRYDLWGASYEVLMDSIASLLTLPEETIVLSGHGPETTIGSERKTMR